MKSHTDNNTIKNTRKNYNIVRTNDVVIINWVRIEFKYINLKEKERERE
jgi:hypothetical protein